MNMNDGKEKGYLHASQGGPAHVQEDAIENRHGYDLRTNTMT